MINWTYIIDFAIIAILFRYLNEFHVAYAIYSSRAQSKLVTQSQYKPPQQSGFSAFKAYRNHLCKCLTTVFCDQKVESSNGCIK